MGLVILFEKSFTASHFGFSLDARIPLNSLHVSSEQMVSSLRLESLPFVYKCFVVTVFVKAANGGSDKPYLISSK
jgi:hypothetical protein